MYAFVMQPMTIPKEYYSWMIKTARMPANSLSLNRRNVRALESGDGHPSAADILRTITENKGTAGAKIRALDYFNACGGKMPVMPCSVLHPRERHCVRYNLALWIKVFATTSPVYAALNFVPMILLKTDVLLKRPLPILKRNAQSTFRSAAFLATYVFIYMSLICLHRNSVKYNHIFRGDHKATYYIYGVLCASSIFIEAKQRRSELAMYVLPKGLQSLWTVLYARGQMIRVPYFDVIMSSVGMGVLMSVYQTEPHRMSTLLFKVMEKVIGRY
ncbi:hypothetical protein HK097_009066 [Rhizophlyctis rosea]|uniref:Transmembrane protein 135 N-terminal domain-containing protein n=1 Tax=Rhizophlyctis rosea TaxID=64517 RepID=A0AAD5X1B8_9FUNG|nr:hypothetical protein HK097_009066 [Rhizophlyctis rosea]